MLEIRPTHLKPAREFVGKYHRHNIPPVGGKFAISCFESERLCGVAICGRPTARKLDDGATLEIIKCKEGNKEFMKERPARRPFGNTVLICEYPIDDTAAEEPNAKLITWRLAKRAARDFLRVSFMPSAIVSAATHGGKTAVRVYGKY